MRWAMQIPNVGAEWSSDTAAVMPFGSFFISFGGD